MSPAATAIQRVKCGIGAGVLLESVARRLNAEVQSQQEKRSGLLLYRFSPMGSSI